MNITLMNENETSHFDDFPGFFLFFGTFITYTFILFNFNKVSVNADSKKNSIFIRESLNNSHFLKKRVSFLTWLAWLK